MLLLAILVLGMFAGWVAHALVGRGRIDWTVALFVGISGSYVGGLLASVLAGDGFAIRASGIIGSIVGATIVLFVYERVQRRSAPKPKPKAKPNARSSRR